MADACPGDVPVELAGGKVVLPGDGITLADLCELVPLLIETMGGVGNGNGAIAPGSQVPIAGQTPSGALALPNQRPGAVGGNGGPVMTGGGGGFGGGGGGRGRQGDRGATGATGPAGPGTIAPPVVKTDGNFTASSVSPFIPIPGTDISFTTVRTGPALFVIQAVFGGDTVAARANGQIGLRVDGVDYPLTATSLIDGGSGMAQYLADASGSITVPPLSAGIHSAQLIVRGDSSLGTPSGDPVIVQANATIPLRLGLIHQ